MNCQSCQHYHGKGYGHDPLICAMHPYGPEGDSCEDFEAGWPQLPRLTEIFTEPSVMQAFENAAIDMATAVQVYQRLILPGDIYYPTRFNCRCIVPRFVVGSENEITTVEIDPSETQLNSD